MTQEEYREKYKDVTTELVEVIEETYGGCGTYTHTIKVYRVGDELHRVTFEKYSVPNPDKKAYGEYQCVSRHDKKVERVMRKQFIEREWTPTELLYEQTYFI